MWNVVWATQCKGFVVTATEKKYSILLLGAACAEQCIITYKKLVEGYMRARKFVVDGPSVVSFDLKLVKI